MRLNIIWKMLRPLVSIFLKIKFGYRYKKATNLPDNYIVLANHTTDFDPLFVGVSFEKNMRFVASGHIARWGFTYKLIDFLLSPIIRQKGAPATTAIKEIMKTCKNGGNVAMFPEGVRSWDGAMSPILPSTAKMVRGLGCGLVTYRIQGGYFSSPMWSGKGTRRGPIFGEVVNVYTKEQLKAMTNEEVYEAIVADISVDAYEEQLARAKRYRGKRLAEKMESLLFICPECGERDGISSEGENVFCKHCGMSFAYDEYGMLQGTRFGTVKELSDWQKKQVEEDIEKQEPYTLNEARLVTIENNKETLVATGTVKMDSEGITCGEEKFSLEEITEFAMHGKKAIVFTANKKYYEMIPTGEENSLKIFLYFVQCRKER